MVRITSASTTGDRSGPKWAAGTVIPSRPLASRAASSAYGTVPARSRPITPLAIELGVGPGRRERFRCGEENLRPARRSR